MFNFSIISNTITLFLKRYVKFELFFWQIVRTNLYLSVLHLHCLQTKWRHEACTFKKLSENLKGFIMFSVRNTVGFFCLGICTKKYWYLTFDSVFHTYLDEFEKKINSGSLSYKPNITANSTHLPALFCPKYLVLPSNSQCKILISFTFLKSYDKVDLETRVKCWKVFCCTIPSE